MEQGGSGSILLLSTTLENNKVIYQCKYLVDYFRPHFPLQQLMLCVSLNGSVQEFYWTLYPGVDFCHVVLIKQSYYKF